MRRAVLTSVLSALALTSVTITGAAVTLTGAEPQPAPPAGDAPSDATTSQGTLAPPVDVEDAPIGIADIALVAADGPRIEDIPSPAMAAYQRAAAVLEGADKGCHLQWTLAAAVGQVVTAHGTTGGGSLGQTGVMRPRLYGKPLRDQKGRRLPDSDAGRLDDDRRHDRPVGPMQLAPSTWAVVGVDSDGDGRRNPHDIDDAALAIAVLLCSGEDDLRKRAGRVDAVRLVNDDRTFVKTVLAVERGYRVQLATEPGTVPVVVPNTPPADHSIDARTAVATDLPTDLPTVRQPSDPGSSATDPVTPLPQPPDPSTDPTTDPTDPTTDPTDPTDTPTDCPVDPSDVPPDPTDSPPVTDPSHPTTTETVTPVTTDDTTDDPTDDPTDVPTDDPTDDPTCAEDPAD